MRGYTLIEILISVGILVLLMGGSLLAVSSAARTARGQQGAELMMDALYRARRQAQLSLQGGAWGVYLGYDEGDRILDDLVVFHGDSYATRTTALDAPLQVPTGVAVTSVELAGAGPTTGDDHEIVFAPLEGSTDLYGSINIDVSGVMTQIDISSHGYATRSSF